MVRWFDWLLVPISALVILFGIICTIEMIGAIVANTRFDGRLWSEHNESLLLRMLGLLIIMALFGTYLSSI